MAGTSPAPSLPVRAAVLLNLTSGRAAPSRVQIQALFARHTVGVNLFPVTGATLGAGIQDALAVRPDILVAGGGDGTANAVANAAIGADLPFGLLPTGTLNHFARDAGLPTDMAAAVRTIARGATVGVDVADINGRFFLNNSSIGLYPRLVHQREQLRDRKGHGRFAATAVAALRLWTADQGLEVAIHTRGQTLRRRTPFVFVGNNPYEMRFFDIGRRSSLDTGRLSVYFSRRTGRSTHVRLALRSVLGRLAQSEDFENLTSTAVTLNSRRSKLRVAIDGEVSRVAPPLRYRIHPRTLRLRTPRRRRP